MTTKQVIVKNNRERLRIKKQGDSARTGPATSEKIKKRQKTQKEGGGKMFSALLLKCRNLTSMLYLMFRLLHQFVK